MVELKKKRDLKEFTVMDSSDDLNNTEELWEKSLKKKYNDELDMIFKKLNTNKAVQNEFNVGKTVTFYEAKQRYELDSNVVEVFIKNAEEERNLKKKYAFWLLLIFTIQFVLYNVIVIFVGCKILIFTETTFNIYIAGGVVEVIALIKIIVTHLFKDNITEALKNVLEKNKVKK